jgi:hypothetical protein
MESIEPAANGIAGLRANEFDGKSATAVKPTMNANFISASPPSRALPAISLSNADRHAGCPQVGSGELALNGVVWGVICLSAYLAAHTPSNDAGGARR